MAGPRGARGRERARLTLALALGGVLLAGALGGAGGAEGQGAGALGRGLAAAADNGRPSTERPGKGRSPPIYWYNSSPPPPSKYEWTPAPKLSYFASPPPPPAPPPYGPPFSLQVYMLRGSTGEEVSVSHRNNLLSCYLENSTSLCDTHTLYLKFSDVPEELSGRMKWAFLFDDVVFNVQPSGGYIRDGATIAVSVDVNEQHAPSGKSVLDILFVTNQEVCRGWGKEAAAQWGKKGGNWRDLDRAFGLPCPAAVYAYTLSAVLDSGLLIIPAVHSVKLPHEGEIDLASSVVYVESVPTGTETNVEVSISSCDGALLLAESDDFSAVRKHVPQSANFRLKGETSVFGNFSGERNTDCWITFSHTDSKSGEVKSESVLLEVQAVPGPPSKNSEILNATFHQNGRVTIPIVPRDALGNRCDRTWDSTAFKVWAFHGSPPSFLELGPSQAVGGGSVSHAVYLDSAPEALEAGTYILRGALTAPEAEGGRIIEHLNSEAALTIPPVQCLRKGEEAGQGDRFCTCSAGFEGDARGGGGAVLQSLATAGCSQCPLGSFKATAGNTDCDPCPEGSTTRSPGASTLEQCVCPSGSTLMDGECVCAAGWSLNSDSDTCETCPVGSWKDAASSSRPCEECSAILGEGATTLGGGSVRADQCVCSLDFYLSTDPIRCVSCPEGGLCNGGPVEAIVAREGFWRSHHSSDRLHACESPRGVALCTGGSVSHGAAVPAVGDDLCMEGHAGPLCWSCSPGYGKNLNICSECSSGGSSVTSVGYVVFGLLFLMSLLMLLVSQSLKRAVIPEGDLASETGSSPDGITVGVAKIMINWIQMSSLAAGVRVSMSMEMQMLLSAEDLGNVSPWSFGSFNCLAPMGFYVRYYCAAAVPPACVLLAVLVAGIQHVSGFPRSQIHAKGRGREWHWKDVFVMATQMLWFFAYSMLTAIILSVFRCRELDPGVWVLSEDPTVSCRTKQHNMAIGVGIALVLIICLGIPLQAFVNLWRAKEDLHLQQTRVRFGLFYINYRPELYWWECYAMLRKFSVVAVVVLFQNATGSQCFVLSVLSVLFLTVHSHFKPYSIGILNTLETAALFVNALTLNTCAYFYASPSSGGMAEKVWSYFMILLSLVLVTWCVLLVVGDVTESLYKPSSRRKGRVGKIYAKIAHMGNLQAPPGRAPAQSICMREAMIPSRVRSSTAATPQWGIFLDHQSAAAGGVSGPRGRDSVSNPLARIEEGDDAAPRNTSEEIIVNPLSDQRK